MDPRTHGCWCLACTRTMLYTVNVPVHKVGTRVVGMECDDATFEAIDWFIRKG